MDKWNRFCKNLRFQSAQGGVAREMAERKHDMSDNNWIKEDGNFSAVTRGSFETDSFKWVPAILAVLSEMLEIKERKKFRVTIVCDPETGQIRWEREEIT